MTVKKGDKVKVEYEGSFDDGTVFDKSEIHGKPLEFEVGSGQVIKGFDEALIGMKKGEEKTVKLKSADAYGEPKKELVQKIPRDHLPKDKEPAVDMMLLMGLPDGKQMPARIVDLTDKEVTVDINHPLAGKDLNFKLKIVDIL
ncbi:peptidylprolyl isomerase [archaeon]|nr:peptidylprolyl isomerase [archaeon]MBL7057663.1 peptidylprolyl isomerase [Candidatus Woesearchaeota archaeon]